MKNDLITKGDAVKAVLDWMDLHKREVIHKQDITDVIMPLSEEIIRCKDCKYYEIGWLKADGSDDKRYKPSVCVNGKYSINRKPDWFCADAERKENG